MKKVSLLICSLVLITGCSTQSYVVNPTAKTTPTFEKSQAFFVGGVGQQKVVNAEKICKGYHNIAKVETKETAVDIVLGIVTFGIYTPRTVSVYCQ